MADRFNVEIYQTEKGETPYLKWEKQLDRSVRAQVRGRINRLRLGNFGDCKPLEKGISELRIHKGPGYRIYFGRVGKRVVLLLCGGDKSSQTRDIKKAIAYWEDYKSNPKKEDIL